MNKELNFNFDDIMMDIYRDVSLFKGLYRLISLLITISYCVLLFVEIDYNGLLPFTKSMTSFSGSSRLMHDIMMVCYLFMFFIISFKYLIFGISPHTKVRFKKYETFLQVNNLVSNSKPRKLILIFGPIFILIPMVGLIYAFCFSSQGDGGFILRNFGGYKSFIMPIIVFILFSFNVLLLITCLAFMEAQKNVL